MYGSKVHAWLGSYVESSVWSRASMSFFCSNLRFLSYSIGFVTVFFIDMLTHRGFSAWVASNNKVLPEHLVAAMKNLIAFRVRSRVQVQRVMYVLNPFPSDSSDS